MVFVKIKLDLIFKDLSENELTVQAQVKINLLILK